MKRKVKKCYAIVIKLLKKTKYIGVDVDKLPNESIFMYETKLDRDIAFKLFRQQIFSIKKTDNCFYFE